MEVKIELPNNVKVTCPTALCAITILRCVSYRASGSSLNTTPLGYSPPLGFSTAGRPSEGEPWQPAADGEDSVRARLEEFDDFDVRGTTYDQGVVEAQIVNRNPAPAVEAEDGEIEDDDDGFEERNPRGGLASGEIEAEIEESEIEDETSEQEFIGNDEPRKPNTRSRHAGSLQGDDSHPGSVGELYIPVASKGVGERTRAVFNFIRNRLVFSMDDIMKYAKKDLGLEKGKKTKRRMRKALKIIKKAGFIEKTGTKREWRRVS